MQRIVRWYPRIMTQGPYDGDNPLRGYPPHAGAVQFMDLSPETLAELPKLQAALTKDGQLGRVVSHTYAADFFTFIVEFDPPR